MKAQLIELFNEGSSQTNEKFYEEFCKKLVKIYTTKCRTKSTIWGSKPVSFSDAQPLESSLITVFKGAMAQKEKGYKISNTDLMPFANAVVLYWTGVMFDITPPPGGSTGISTILSGGDAMTLATNLALGLNAGAGSLNLDVSIETCATLLDTAFKLNESQIQGNWIGLTSTVPPVPITIPWNGLS